MPLQRMLRVNKTTTVRGIFGAPKCFLGSDRPFEVEFSLCISGWICGDSCAQASTPAHFRLIYITNERMLRKTNERIAKS
jgi:hypothetical protein